MVTRVRDGTGRDCFDIFGGRAVEDGTRRAGKRIKPIVCWTGWNGTDIE